MHPFIQKHHRFLFYTGWILLGLIQCTFTELQDDEAYYWVYGQYLDWGYFDHPPMIGLLVKMGYSIIPNELGVRLFPFILHVLSIWIMQRLTGGKNPFLFYTIVLSIAVLQVSGFMAVPDIPLIFFTALFFLCYKKFIETFSFPYTTALGLAVALLFYSKYHAVLIVFFTLLSNPKLFSRYQTYLAGIIALVLFAPHLWWQYQHDWVSFRYHLFESNVNAYKFSFTADYIIGQLLLPGPIAGLILLPAAISIRPSDIFERALRFTLIGIYIFFLLSSFRGQVEANWTSPALVPLILLSHRYLNEHDRWRRWLIKLLPVTVLLVIAARIFMIADLLPVKAIQLRYHAWQDWPAEMREKTKGLNIVFSNSYQRASKYWFYSGQPTYSQNQYRERKNNYNFWPIEDSMLGKPVYFLDKYSLSRFPDSIKTPIGFVGFRYDSSLASFAKINILVSPSSVRINKNQPVLLNCRFEIPPHYTTYIRNHPTLDDSTRVGIFNKKGWIKDFFLPVKLATVVQNPEQDFSFLPGLEPGKYYLRFAIHAGHNNPTHNSIRIPLIVD